MADNNGCGCSGWLIVGFIGLLWYANPSLDYCKEYLEKGNLSTMLAQGMVTSLSDNHIGYTVCRENYFLFSKYYLTANVEAFGLNVKTRGTCTPLCYGVCGMFFDVGKEAREKAEADAKQDKSADDCPDDCVNLDK